MRRLLIMCLGIALATGAVQSLPAAAAAPPDAPVITSPAASTTIDGSVSLSATTDTGTTVEFTVSDTAGNSSTLSADVTGGVATTDFEGYGWSGEVTLSARACNADGCGPMTVGPTGLSVRNTDLEFDQPTIDLRLASDDDLAVPISAHADGGWLSVQYETWWGDTEIGAGDSAVSATLDVDWQQGSRQLELVRCNDARTVCAESVMGPTIEIWTGLSPWIDTVESYWRWSPNGDGRRDRARVDVYLSDIDVPQDVYWSVATEDGTEVVAPTLGVGGVTGTQASFWIDPFKVIGSTLPDGTYTLVVTARATWEGVPIEGSQEFVHLQADSTAPEISRPSVSSNRFFPQRDDYRDLIAGGASIDNSTNYVDHVAEVINSSGKKVDQLRPVSLTARARFRWDGRLAKGRLAPAGRYKFRFVSMDSAGNRATVDSASFSLSHKKLRIRHATKKVVPARSVVRNYSGKCSSLAANVRGRGSLGYLSLTKCQKRKEAFAGALHATKLKKAIKYGTVRVYATGASLTPGGEDNAAMQWLQKNGKWQSGYARLKPKAGTYRSRPISGGRAVFPSREVGWMVGTSIGFRYVVKSFKVKYAYYVLR